jgi:hypothetical protein
VVFERPNLSKSDLGEASRQMTCARLLLAGVKVFRPMGEDTPIDLLVLTESGKVLRCQCKCLYPETKAGKATGAHLMNLYSIRKNGPASKAVKHKYTSEEVDFFLGYCLSNDGVYVIPYSVAANRSHLIFWIDRDPGHFNGTSSFDHKSWLNAYQYLL